MASAAPIFEKSALSAAVSPEALTAEIRDPAGTATGGDVPSEPSSNPGHHPEVALHSIQMLKQLPIVEATLEKGIDIYERVKKSNGIISWGFDIIEKAVATVTQKSLPYLTKFETSIIAVDNLVSQGICELEKKLPIVKETPDKIYEVAVKNVIEVVKPVYNVVASVGNYGMSTATSLKGFCKQNIQTATSSIGNWATAFEKHLDDISSKWQSEGSRSPSSATSVEQTSSGSQQLSADVSPSVVSCLRTTARLGLKTTFVGARLSLGVARWMLARVPVVGAVFSTQQCEIKEQSQPAPPAPASPAQLSLAVPTVVATPSAVSTVQAPSVTSQAASPK